MQTTILQDVRQKRVKFPNETSRNATSLERKYCDGLSNKKKRPLNEFKPPFGKIKTALWKNLLAALF